MSASVLMSKPLPRVLAVLTLLAAMLVSTVVTAVEAHADDGLELHGAFVAAAVRCAPPANKPLPVERDNCLPYAAEELRLIDPAVIVCLGKFAWDAACLLHSVRPRPRFGHLAEFQLPDGPVLVGSFHPSQQNTFTGRLTEPMLDAVFERAAHIAGDGVMVPRARNP